MAATRETADERRARLIDVARDVIASEGVAACTFRRLAAAAGTSTRPFTHAFGTRDDLLRAVALSTWEGAGFDVSDPRAVERPAGWDCAEELKAIGEHWLPLSEPQTVAERLYLEIVLYSLTRPRLHDELLGFSYAANAHIAALVAAGQADGQIASRDAPERIAITLIALQAGIAFTTIHEPAALPPDEARSVWREGVDRILRG